MTGIRFLRTTGLCVLAVWFIGGSAKAVSARNGQGIRQKSVRLLAEDKKDDAKGKKEEEPKGDPVDVDKLPKAVVNAVKKAYPGAVIAKAMKLEDGNYYLDDVKVGKKIWDFTVSPEGKIVKEIEMKEGI